MIRRPARAAAILAGFALVLSVVSINAAPAFAEGPSSLSLTKTASVTTVAPGQTFTYELEVGCTAIDVGTGCTNAQLTDPVPAQFQVLSVDVGSGLSATPPVVTNNTVTVTFNQPLQDPPGSVGLTASATGVVTITVQADPNLPFSANGIPIDNTGEFTATNQLAPADSTASVTPIVPLNLSTSASKSYNPNSDEAAPGTATTATIGAVNNSNAPVDSIQLTDPTDPTATPNPFQFLGVADLGAVTFPSGADQVEVDAFVNGAWVDGAPAASATLPDLPPGTTASDITGLRYTFTSSGGGAIGIGATASADIDLTQRANVASLIAAERVVNGMTAQVAVGAQTATDTASAIYTILPDVVNVQATKVFSPNQVVAGSPSTATITGTNNSTGPLNTMTIVDPEETSGDAFADGFDPGTTFTGFTSGVEWPSGATAATVTYDYTDGTQETLPATAPDTLPPPSAANASKTVTRFSAEFSGAITPGAEATVPFSVATDPNQANTPASFPNTAAVLGTNRAGGSGFDDATDTLTVYAVQLSASVGKKIVPGQILSVPGQFATVELPAQLDPFPASTTNASQLVVQDPEVSPPTLTPWWNSFNATAITQTAVPDGDTMTVDYWDGNAWINLPGAVDIPGPQLFSEAIPAALQNTVQGLRFTFNSPDGITPGTKVQPNITTQLRSQLRDGSGPATGAMNTIENCAAVFAHDGPGVDAQNTTPAPCPTITLNPTLPGAGDLIDKSWFAPRVVTARSQSNLPAQINWSTGGLSNQISMTISDPADPETTPISNSVFDAFNLVNVPAISAAQDPLLKFDEIQAVQLYDGSSWVDATNDPCPGQCDGTFPGVTLTTAEQASAVGVRLIYVESPTRAITDIGDPTAPVVGSGVASSIGNNRGIVFTFQIRDDVRDPLTTPDPVVGTRIYNTPNPGDVLNTARATAVDAAGTVTTDTASDTASILDVPLNVGVSKTWSGGPLGVPSPGTPAASYPSGRVSTTARNATAAAVDTLTLTDPGPGSGTDPFDTFDLTHFATISVPTGATSTQVLLTDSNGVTTSFTAAQALALPATSLSTIVSVEVVYNGRIAAGASGSVSFDTRLRATSRSDGTPITAVTDPTVANDAQASVIDEGGAPGGTPTLDASASIALVSGTITVTAGKSFTPASQSEGDDSPVTMNINGRPGGSVRTTQMTLTDDSGTFWNAFSYQGLASGFALAAPINRVEVDACVGRTFDAATITEDCTDAGGTWIDGTLLTAAQFIANPLPPGVTPAQVDGLRYTFTRADGALWENPASPLQTVPVSVQRRTNLQTGGPVPTNLVGNTPAPGETAAGTTTNLVEADVVGSFGNGGTLLTASNTATAQMQFLHATTSVAVRKGPSGSQQAGTVIPFTLSVTNNGTIALTNPVITDNIPTDAGGPQLVFDPLADPNGPGPYSFALTGAARIPPSGPALPTTPSDVTIAVNAAKTQIQFSFPPGSVLEVGQNYTITVQLILRPGLAGNTSVTNTFGVVADRPFDGCSGTLVAGQCTTGTTVVEAVTGAIRGVKSVRATDPSLGVNKTIPGATCTPDASGFYSGACVPVTAPGSTEVWRLTFTNSGTLPINQVVAIDKLPTPGDTSALTPILRGSQWRPIYDNSSVLSQAPSGATMTLNYTTAALPCVLDLNITGSPHCAAGQWLPWSAAVDPTTITGLQFIVTMPTPLAPAAGISIDVTTTTPAYSPGSGTDPVAWNTVAVAAKYTNGAATATTPRTEGNKVGVALATGPATFVKVVTGAGAAFAPTVFSGNTDCVSAGVTIPPRLVILSGDGTPVTLTDLPYGAVCTFTETDAGQTSVSATTVTIDRPTDPTGVVTITNTYDLASLVVTKAVTSNAVDQNGNPIDYGTFPVTVDCSFLGSPVFADGFSAGTGDVVLGGTNPLSADIANVATGAVCDITETATGGANDSTVSPGELTVGTDTASDVTVTNTFLAGALEVTKARVGPGAAEYGDGPFVVQLSCLRDVDGTPTDVTIPGGATRSLDSTDSYVADYSSLPATATCELTETTTGGATSSEILDSGGGPVTDFTIDSGVTTALTVQNTFDVGSILVTKSIDGANAGSLGGGTFTVHLTCSADIDGVQTDVPVPGGQDQQLSRATSLLARYDGILAGADCQLTETSSGGATSVVITPNAGDEHVGVATVPDGGVAELSVVNHFDPPVTPEAGASGGASSLPDTGSNLWPWLMGGLASLALGALLIVPRWRRRQS